jgi:TRAP-type C4-dicarboxylate transport system substrate-binding protein
MRGVVLLLAALAAGPALAQTAWDMAIAWPPGNFHTKNAMAYAAAVEKASAGQVKITVQPGGVLGLKGPESLRAVRDGIVPIAEFNAPQQVGDAPLFGIETLPYLMNDYTELRALHKLVRPQYDQVAAKFNQKILYMVPWPNQYFFFKNPVAKTADVKDLKIRTTDRNTSELVKGVGMVPVQMAFADMMPALASGALAGVTTSASTAVDSRFWDFLKYAYKTNHLWSSNVMSVNLAAYNKLTPDQRTTLERVAREMEPGFWKVSEEDDTKSAATLKEHGMQVVAPPEAWTADMRKVSHEMWDEFAKRTGEPAASLLKQYRASAKK